MAAMNESGHYAIAGFLFQLFGTGVEALEVCGSFEGDEEPNVVLVLERFGQDAVVWPTNGGTTKPKLIQYKFSSKDETITPSELREILQAMLKSVRSQGFTVDQLDYHLVTNRHYSPQTKTWEATASETELVELIKKSSDSDVVDAAELAMIYRKLKYDRQTLDHFRQKVISAAAKFGVLESEIDDRIDGLVGLLLSNAGEPGRRIVHRSELHRKLTGYDNPYGLLSDRSIGIRQNAVAQFKRDQTGGRETILRPVSDEIAKAVLEHTVVVVVGDGGSGKSVAVADAVASGLQNVDEPPGFGLVLPALNSNANTVMQSVATWRNLLQHNDGQNLKQSLLRLRIAYDKNPVLIVAFEAIDEKDGQARLSTDSRHFIQMMIDKAIHEKSHNGVPAISVVLTCRRAEELDNLTGGGWTFSHDYHRIRVTDFDGDEIERLAARLRNDEIRRRIQEQIRTSFSVLGQTRQSKTNTASSDVIDAISHPVIWQLFSELEFNEQHAVLDGSSHGFDQLASQYLDWFCRKAENRNSFASEECQTALVAIAQRFNGNSARIGERASDWTTPCLKSGCSRVNANQLFNEARTAGVIIDVENRGSRWRWRHQWFCDYLLRQLEQ